MDTILDGELPQPREVDRAGEGLGARGREEAAREGQALESVEVQQLVAGVGISVGVGERRDVPRRAAEKEVLIGILRAHITSATQREQPQCFRRRLQDLVDDIIVGSGRGIGGRRAKGWETAVGERREAALQHERE